MEDLMPATMRGLKNRQHVAGDRMVREGERREVLVDDDLRWRFRWSAGQVGFVGGKLSKRGLECPVGCYQCEVVRSLLAELPSGVEGAWSAAGLGQASQPIT